MTQRSRRFSRHAMTFMGLAVGLVIVIVIVMAGGCRGSQNVPAGDVIADLRLPQLDGTVFDPAAVRGKKVLLNFWSPG